MRHRILEGVSLRDTTHHTGNELLHIRVVCFSSKVRFAFWNCEVGGLIVLSHTNTPRLSTWSNSCCSIVIVVWTMSENYTLEKQVVTIAFRHQRSTAVLAWICVLYLMEIAIQTMWME